ncbi:16S rRNA (guanine(966)-N(2))-methyltransferase RsmD [bacterium]|nr:16S rRNA (guanine(966)-N(2))-methyltransferase RsmD [bacterium]
MRIITGRFGRRKLLTNPGQITRPITDRVKESLFQFLRDELVDARVADIFSGTGTLGLEALSRGAHSVVFFEKDRIAVDLLRKNVASLRCEDETLCWQTDVAKTSFRPKNCDGFLPYTLLFFDPPYKLVPEIQSGTPLFKSLERLARADATADDALMLFRTPQRSLFHIPEFWQCERTIDYSTMEVHWLRKVASKPVADATGEAAEAEEVAQ